MRSLGIERAPLIFSDHFSTLYLICSRRLNESLTSDLTFSGFEQLGTVDLLP